MAPDPRAVLAEQLYNDPQVGPEFKELIAKKYPHAPIPELQARRAVAADNAELRKEITALREERTKERQSAALHAGREAIMRDPALRITEAELPEVEKIMQAGEAGSHRTAAEAYRFRERLTQGAAPSALDFSGMAMPGRAGGAEYQKDEKSGRPGILENRRGWTRHMINEVLQEQAREAPLAPTWR